MIDGGVDLDLEAVVQNIAEADVAAIYFPHLGKTLLIDNRRRGGSVQPLIAVVPIVHGSSERLRAVRRLRPQLPCPESITMIPWARRVDSLIRLGVWEQILERIPNERAAEACLAELRSLELVELRNAITGRHYDSLWSRSP